jgi:hypothetical protein
MGGGRVVELHCDAGIYATCDAGAGTGNNGDGSSSDGINDGGGDDDGVNEAFLLSVLVSLELELLLSSSTTVALKVLLSAWPPDLLVRARDLVSISRLGFASRKGSSAAAR